MALCRSQMPFDQGLLAAVHLTTMPKFSAIDLNSELSNSPPLSVKVDSGTPNSETHSLMKPSITVSGFLLLIIIALLYRVKWSMICR